MKLKSFQKKMCAAAVFIAVITYVLIGYFTNCWTWSLFVFLIIPFMPFLVGLKRISFSYDLLVIIAYLIIGFSIGGWHPWWVLFLTIPIYHIFFDDIKIKKKIKVKFNKEDNVVDVDLDD